MFKSGIIEKDEIWDGEIQVQGDVIIPENVSVRVAAGSRIRFDRLSACDSGVKRKTLGALKMPIPGETDTARCYIVVHGAWEVLGDAENRVVIGNEDWGGGILLLSGKECRIRHALITHAAFGICAMGRSAATIEQTEIAHSSVGIFYPGRAVPSVVEHNTVHDNACGIVSYRLDPESGTDVRIRGNTIAANRLYGIFCAGIRPDIRENTITKNDTGISQNDCDASRIENNDLSGNRVAIHSREIVSTEIIGNRILDSADVGIFNHQQVTKAVISGNTLTSNIKAIACNDVREGVVRGNTIEDAAVGIEISGASSVLVAGCAVHAKKVGIVYGEHSAGTVENTAITGREGPDAIGIRVCGSAEVTITKNEITEVHSGIQCVATARIVAEDNTIYAEAAGMSCTDHASGVIKGNTIGGPAERR